MCRSSGRRRHRAASSRALRVAGYLLLALSWIPCYLNWDVPMGTAAWVMNLAASGFALVFPFAYAPKRSVQAGGVAALLAGLVLARELRDGKSWIPVALLE